MSLLRLVPRRSVFDRKAWTELALSLVLSLSLILVASWVPNF